MNKLKSFFSTHRLFLIFIVFAFYGNTLKNDYALDDYIVTEKDNITAKGVSAIPKIFRSYYVDRSEDVKFDYRPLVKVSYAIEHELFGVNASVSHFFNVFIYLLGLFLLYDTLLLLFSEYDKNFVFYSVALFAILPIHSEVVASLKNRDVLLSFVFCIASLKNMALFFESGQKKWQTLIISLLCFYFAFLSKLDALPYMAIIPVLIFIKYRPNLKWVFTLIILMFLSLLFYKLSKKGILDKTTTKRLYYYFENPLYFEKNLQYKIISTFNSLGFYINQIVFPFKQCCYYGLDTVPVNKLSLHGYLGLLATPIILFGLIKSYLKKDMFLFSGLFMFCASVSMYLNFVVPAVGIVADRFAFFSSLGLMIVIVSLLSKRISLNTKLNMNVKIFFIGVLVLFGSMTFSRNRDWKNLYTLIGADYTKYPNNSFLNYKQGLNLVKQIEDKNSPLTLEQKKIKLVEAKNLIEKSISIDSTYAASHTYLSYILVYLINDFNAALPHINSALKIQETTELYFYKAICMRETKQKDSCEYYLLKCISRNNAYMNAYNLLMFDYNANSEFNKTISLYNQAINKGVHTVEIYNGLGKTYWQMKNNEEAKKYYRKALEINPTNEEASEMLKRL